MSEHWEKTALNKGRLIERVRELERELDEARSLHEGTKSQLRRFVQAVEQGPAAVMITDPKGNIEYVNPKFEVITGFNASEVIGEKPSILKSGETTHKVYDDLWLTIRSGGEWKGVFHNRKKNGELFWERAVIAPVKDTRGATTHYVAVKEDITLQREAEKQHEEERLKFFHQSRMADIGLLAASILHEVGNPIASIHGIISGVLENMCSKSPLDKELTNLKLVLDLTERLATITKEISEFTSPLPDKFELQDLNGIIRATSQLVQFDKRWGKINLILDLDQKLPAFQAFRDQLSQLVVNLLINAADSFVEKITQRSRVTVSTCVEDNSVILKVIDNGSGMPPGVLAHAREAFYTTKLPGKGTGLGLSLCDSIVVGHGGHMKIKSFEHTGTEVIINFPLDGAS